MLSVKFSSLLNKERGGKECNYRDSSLQLPMFQSRHTFHT